MPKKHFIDEKDRHEYDILRPDGPVRNARHNFEHILKCAPRVIILDSDNESNPPATPIREWLSNCNIESSNFEPVNDYLISPRHRRVADGGRLSKKKESLISPINCTSVTISLDQEIQRDRERRQPRFAAEDGYLPDKNRDYLFDFEFKDIIRKKPKLMLPSGEPLKSPRFNGRWPVISAINKTEKGRKEVKTQTIDPRPFNIQPLNIEVSDNRNGFYFLDELNFPSWSPTKLEQWLRCPRSGWLNRSLRIEKEESQDEDLDARTHGDIFHRVHHQLLLDILNFEEKIPRNFGLDLSENQTMNLFTSGIKPEILMKKSLLHLNNICLLYTSPSPRD